MNKTMRKTTTIIISIIVMLIISISTIAGRDPHWYNKRNTASGIHVYYIPAWGGSCPTYGHGTPIKTKNFRKYYNYRFKHRQ